jgi:NitT/TauT family transport system permease protein
VFAWGGNLHLFGLEWRPWMSVSVIAAYLAFFPVAIGALRGLASPSPVQTELLSSLAASWWQTLLRLRLPASVPYLIPALKLAAAAAVIGAIVAEISTGLRGGIGRLIISYAQLATGDPARVYAPIIGAALMGVIAVGLISLLEIGLRRYTSEGAAA